MLQPRIVNSSHKQCISANENSQQIDNKKSNFKLTVPLLSSTMLSTVAATSLLSPIRLFNDFSNYLNGITIKSQRKQMRKTASSTQTSNLTTYLLIASITILCCSSTCMAQLSGEFFFLLFVFEFSIFC